jgi:flagellar motor protein MotB
VDNRTLVVFTAGMFVATIIPSLAFVKFVGDSADSSRGSLSEKTKNDFKKRMMQQPNINFSIPTSEEEELKKQIGKAYMQDKDVDVAVLEEKLRKRAQWRKEMMAQAKTQAASYEDDDGW